MDQTKSCRTCSNSRFNKCLIFDELFNVRLINESIVENVTELVRKAIRQEVSGGNEEALELLEVKIVENLEDRSNYGVVGFIKDNDFHCNKWQ